MLFIFYHDIVLASTNRKQRLCWLENWENVQLQLPKSQRQVTDCKFGQSAISFAPHPPSARITQASSPSGHKMTGTVLRSLANRRKHRINASAERLSLRSSPATLPHVSEFCHLRIIKTITFKELEMNLIDAPKCAPELGRRLSGGMNWGEEWHLKTPKNRPAEDHWLVRNIGANLEDIIESETG